jgi:nickel-type superoxide dismutase maturation protease
MIPTLAPGDEVLVDTRAYAQRAPNVGEIVVVHRPDRGEVIMIKRVAERLPDGGLIVQGDNQTASTDSYEFGPVSPQALIGKATSRFG